MSQFETAYEWMMDNEDARREYKTVSDAPPGARAISGINSQAFPGPFADIDNLLEAERGPHIEAFYRENFWNNWLEQIESDELAKRVFDAAVNMGPGTAVKLLQRAAGETVDGIWGPSTLSTVNAAGDLVPAFQAARRNHYINLLNSNPSLGVYSAAWMARANK